MFVLVELAHYGLCWFQILAYLSALSETEQHFWSISLYLPPNTITSYTVSTDVRETAI